MSLEDAFWNSLKEIAAERGMTLTELVAAIDAGREHGNLSSAIRLFVLGVYRDQRTKTEPAQPLGSFERAEAAGDGRPPL